MIREKLIEEMKTVLNQPGRREVADDFDYINEKALDSLDYLIEKGIIGEDTNYPPIEHYDDINRLIGVEHLVRISEMNLDEALKYGYYNIPNKGYRSVVTFIPTDKCTKGCVHCNVDAITKGTTLDYSLLERSNRVIMNFFDTYHFGIDGEALQTFSRGENEERYFFSDYFEKLLEKGARSFILDTKGVRTKEKRIMQEYEKVADLAKRRAKQFTQRISFNMYSPDVIFETDESKIRATLEDELMPVLTRSLDFANRIIINSTFSFTYDEARVDRTLDYLLEIMTSNGFEYAAFDHDIDGQTFTEPLFFRHKETGRKVELRKAATLNQGRWNKTKQNLTRLNDIPLRERTRVSKVCEGLFLNSFSIYPDGNVYLCGGDWNTRTNLGPIDQSTEEFMATLRRVHNERVEYIRENLDLLVQGRDLNYRCGYTGETTPPRGVRE